MKHAMVVSPARKVGDSVLYHSRSEASPLGEKEGVFPRSPFLDNFRFADYP